MDTQNEDVTLGNLHDAMTHNATLHNESMHDSSFHTQGTHSEPGSPDKRRRHMRSNVYLADLAASSLLEGLATDQKGSSVHTLNPGSSGRPVANTFTQEFQDEQLIYLKESIVISKDRAQIIAATYMTIVHITMLIYTLDGGSKGNNYYNLTLGLIITALILQVVAALIALYITIVNSYCNKYNPGWCCGNLEMYLPCNYCKDHKHSYPDLDDWLEDQDIETLTTQVHRESANGRRLCCSNDKSNTYILSIYSQWQKRAVHAEVKCADIDEELRLLTSTVNKARHELQQLEQLEEDSEEFDSRIREIKNRLVHAEEARLNMERRRFHAKKLKSQGEVLKKYADYIKREGVLKRTAFWQNTLTVLFFVIFILNAVIIGLILSSKNASVGTSWLQNTDINHTVNY